MRFLDQLKSNAVALISLVVAVSSLGYNTWRNEQTEHNRNVRAAGFEVLLGLGDLQRIVFVNFYDDDAITGNPRLGWAYVLDIRDLAMLMPSPMPESADQLFATWETHWRGLDSKAADSEAAISAAIDRTRSDVVAVLTALD